METESSARMYNQIMIADALALYDFLQRNKDKYALLAAMFDSQANRIEGDEFIEVELISSKSSDSIWFYRVKKIEDYVFVPIPVTICYLDHAKVSGSTNPDSNVFRFVDNPMATFTTGGAPNLQVNFSIIGYKPKQLLDRLKEPTSS